MPRCLLITVPEDNGDAVLEVLQQLQIQNVVRTTYEGCTTVRCCVSHGVAGLILHKLDKIGVGVAYGEVALMHVPVLLPRQRNEKTRKRVEAAKKLLNISERMAVEEIYSSVVSGANLNFDYLAFVVAAAIIASAGLGTDNDVMIVASMLVSPLMGPILAFTLATNLRDWRLLGHGLVAEGAGVLLVFTIGYCLGLIASISDTISDVFTWPTNAMSSRGKVTGLIAGIVYAVPSGVCVAVASSNPNFSALVGVAIAASLLPPIANTGLCFGFATTEASRRGEFARIGGLSLALFIVNVLCIYLAGVATFALKRVRHVMRPQTTNYRTLPQPQLPPSTRAEVAVDMASGTSISATAAKWKACAAKAAQEARASKSAPVTPATSAYIAPTAQPSGTLDEPTS